ncbi:MAG: DUF2513 domain-containing protein [Burkholderiaceae bacterium]|jgi:hypothetical protein|nr:DUF2513 domain-containing protein [Burkholderiaceae bacterium]MBE0599740.1 DUF2513 domain-containing protein [Burkholderiaceae bacterium]
MVYRSGKYALDRADETALPGIPLRRIRALRDIPEHGVKADDLGGFVQSERNLSQTGAAWIGRNAVVLGQGRVEDDAIARDQAVLSSYAILRHRAAAGGQSRMDGQAIVQDQAQLTDSSHIGGCARVGGTVIVGGFVSLTYDWNYQTADDLPWSLDSATLDSSDQIDRLHEAVEIDTAYRRVLALLGAKDLAQCRTLLDSLMSPSGGYIGAVQAMARAVGGTFLPYGYLPYSAWDVSAQHFYRIQRLRRRWNLLGCKVVCWVDAAPIPACDHGDGPYAGVALCLTATGFDQTYQPAVFRPPSPVCPPLHPLPMSVRLVPEVHSSLPGAMMRSRDLLALQAGTDAMPQTARGSVSHATDSLPLLLDARPCDDGLRLTMQRDAGVPFSVTVQHGLSDHVDLSGLDAPGSAVLGWRTNRTLSLQLPTPGPALSDTLGRAAATKPKEGSVIMKRDMDLVRGILFEIERNANINGKFVVTDADLGDLSADRTAVQYHLRLLMDAGYIEGQDLLNAPPKEGTPAFAMLELGSQGHAGQGVPITVSRMTWAGHDFLDTVRDNKVWQKTKGYLKDIGGVSIDVLKDVARAVAKDQIRQYTGINLGN